MPRTIAASCRPWLVWAFCCAAIPASAAEAPTAAARPATTPAQTASALRPVPSDAEQKQAAKIVDEVFGTEAALKTRKPADRAEVARKIFKEAVKQTGNSTVDPNVRYVLLTRARDAAASGGDLDTTCSAMDALAAAYQINVPRMRLATFKTLADLPARGRDLAGLIDVLLNAAGEAVAADQYELATQYADLAASAARKGSASPEATAAATTRLRELREARTAYAALQKQVETLAADPQNAEANAALGRFYCLVVDDWKRGVPMLAAGNDAPCKSAAQKEIAGTAKAGAKAAIGAEWVELAKKETAAAKTRLLLHAIELYEQASGEADGLEQRRIENELAKVMLLLPAELRGENARTVDVLARVNPPRYKTQGTVAADPDGFRCGPALQSGLVTAGPVPVPFKAEIEAKTDSTNLRIGYGKGFVIFNYEGDLGNLQVKDPGTGKLVGFPGKGEVPKNQYVRVEVRITANAMDVLVDKQLRAHLVGEYGGAEPVRVFCDNGSTITVRGFKVTPLR